MKSVKCNELFVISKIEERELFLLMMAFDKACTDLCRSHRKSYRMPPTKPAIFGKNGLRVKKPEPFDKRKAFEKLNRRRLYQPERKARKEVEISKPHLRARKRYRKLLNKSAEKTIKNPVR